MKMYMLTNDSYGQDYFVLAKNESEALDFIKNSKESGVELFKESSIENLPRNFIIREYSEGQVVREEIC